MTTTPRTDKHHSLRFFTRDRNGVSEDYEYVESEFARELEREADEAIEAARKANDLSMRLLNERNEVATYAERSEKALRQWRSILTGGTYDKALVDETDALLASLSQFPQSTDPAQTLWRCRNIGCGHDEDTYLGLIREAGRVVEKLLAPPVVEEGEKTSEWTATEVNRAAYGFAAKLRSPKEGA